MGLVLPRRSHVRFVDTQDTAQRPDPALLLTSEFVATAWKRCGENRFAAEALKMHARRSRDFTYALAADWRSRSGKTAARDQAFRPDLYQAQILTSDPRQLERRGSGLRFRCGEPEAKWRHRNQRPKRHAAASGFFRGGWMASDRSAMLADAMKLRKIFHREAAASKPFIGHARKLRDVPKTAADRATL
jgi:hypothetical protein